MPPTVDHNLALNVTTEPRESFGDELRSTAAQTEQTDDLTLVHAELDCREPRRTRMRPTADLQRGLAATVGGPGRVKNDVFFLAQHVRDQRGWRARAGRDRRDELPVAQH